MGRSTFVLVLVTSGVFGQINQGWIEGNASLYELQYGAPSLVPVQYCVQQRNG